MSIPLGFRFMPTHEELITCYLLTKALGFKVPCNHHILEKPLYGENADPTNVFSDVDESHWVVSEGNDRVIYVLTKLSKINNDKTRISRRAGCGTWSGQTGGKRIKNGSGELIGSMKMFGFEAAKKRDDYHWIMHEYSLAGIYSDRKHKDYVICKIRRTSKRKGGGVRDDDVGAPSSFKKLKAATITDPTLMSLDDCFACSTGPSIREYIPVLTADSREECNDSVDGAPSFEKLKAAIVSNYQEEDDCLMNLDGCFACSNLLDHVREYVPVLTAEESINRVGDVSKGGNGQPLADSVFDHRTWNILDDDYACPTGLDEVERPEESKDSNSEDVVSTLADSVSDSKSIYLEEPDLEFNLDDLEFNLDGLDLFMGSLI